jgi:hypothetical protein
MTKEGFFMGSSLSQSPRRGSNSFQKIVDGFLKQPGLPFSTVLTPRLIEEVFRKHEALFGIGAIYCTATVLWAFLGQVLRDGKMAACQAAVAQIIAHRKLLGLSVPTEYTGDYCRARAKLDEQALRELTQAVGENAEAESDSKWLLTDAMPSWSVASRSPYPTPKKTKASTRKRKLSDRESERWCHKAPMFAAASIICVIATFGVASGWVSTIT